MTVCIAALAENNKKLVLVADQMITANIPIAYQFETSDVKKIYELNDIAVILTAGNALFAHEIIANVQKKMLSEVPSKKTHTIEEIAESIRKEYQDFRRKLVIQRYLEPRGLNLQNYYNMQQSLHMGVVQEIEKQLSDLNIGVDLIVAGHNPSEDCHIYSVTHPGILISHDAVGHIAVGTGAPHAVYHLIGSQYKKTMKEEDVKKLVQDAKLKSEVAPGVGRETTVLVLPKV